MIGAVFLILIFFLINQIFFSVYERKHSFFSKKEMNLLYFYHTAFFWIYYIYAQNNASDSKSYFLKISSHTDSLFSLYGTDTNSIYFVGYLFSQIGITTYAMQMFLFSWFGFLGFMYAYLFFRENIRVKIKVLGNIDLLTLILFFPNMHFWTASLGKGAPIFMGLMMFVYAIIRPKSRIILLILASLLIFHIRPHVFFFAAVGGVVGYLSGKEKVPLQQKIFVSVALLAALIVAQDKILGVAGLQNSENLIEDFQSFSEDRSQGLSKGAGSGVDMSSYPLPFKLFTFWFRPLFIDAPTFLGIIVSFENLIYLFLFFKILKKDFLKFIKKAPSVVKMSLVIFFTTSLAMTFVMSNLGIIMRQKSMVMYFLFFVIYYYLAQKKYNKVMRIRQLKKRRLNNMKVMV